MSKKFLPSSFIFQKKYVPSQFKNSVRMENHTNMMLVVMAIIKNKKVGRRRRNINVREQVWPQI
jgi:hypothetical protein